MKELHDRMGSGESADEQSGRMGHLHKVLIKL